MNFVHLHVHTEYSIVDSIIRVNDLVNQVKQYNMPAVGVADHNNLYSAVKLYTACLKQGVKPIIGVEALVHNPIEPGKPYTLVLLSQNMQGYRSICGLVTRAQHEGRSSGGACISREWLTGKTDGIIALSGAQNGEIGQCLIQGKHAEALQLLEEYRKLFPDRFYVEISRIGDAFESIYCKTAVDLANATQTPLVATNQPRFVDSNDFGYHEIRACINDGTVVSDRGRMLASTEQQYLRSTEEMIECFSDLPSAIENTVEIAKRCNLQFELHTSHLPAYPHVDKNVDIDEFLSEQSMAGLKRHFPEGAPQEYVSRLHHELEIIRTTKFAGYFLIVTEIIDWAKHEGIPVGPGRGSGAGSLVAYCLGITGIDPMSYGLIFERFLNPERVSPPDFDIDFCVDQRDRVIQHVSDTYGKDHVAQIVTYNTLAARAAVRDVGRAIQPDYSFYDRLANMIPRELDITLDQAMKKNRDLKQRYNDEPRVKELMDSAEKLEGVIRNVSKHPGGVVIAPTIITDFSATFVDTESELDITHYDKDDLETIGLVKFDFLGLTTLTIISRAFEMINRSRSSDAAPLSTNDISLEDQQTYDLIQSGNTVGIFQLESKGMQRLIIGSKPHKFDDLVALLALFRPGPLQTGMDKTYIKNKEGNETVEYLDPALKEVLNTTYGVFLYQEQVMHVAQLMGGYSLGEADLLRRAMGKKLAEEMARQRDRFVSGAKDRGYKREVATKVFDLMESFAGYGFNKSHSVAYAMLAFQTAWLKRHYATQFFAACISVDFKTDTTMKIIFDAKRMGIKVFSPDINRSEYEFVALDDETILFGLGGLKQIGRPVSDAIVSERNENGPFKSIVDFFQRVDLRKVGKFAVESLTSAGCFDSLEPNRSRVFANAEALHAYGKTLAEDKIAGQMNIFADTSERVDEFEFSTTQIWTEYERLKYENRVFGFHLNGHPEQLQIEELHSLKKFKMVDDLESEEPKSVTVCGWIRNRQVVNTRTGKQMGFFDLTDQSGEVAVSVFTDVYPHYADAIVEDSIVTVLGKAVPDDRTTGIKFVADAVIPLDSVQSMPEAMLKLKVNGNSTSNSLEQLRDAVDSNSGIQVVRVEYVSKSGESASFILGKDSRGKNFQSVIGRVA